MGYANISRPRQLNKDPRPYHASHTVQSLMNHQPLSGMHQSEFTYEGLFEEYEYGAEERIVGGTIEGDELFRLLNESEEAYEAATITALGVGPSHFDMNSNATISTSGTFNDTKQFEQHESSPPFSYANPDLGISFAQSHACWGDLPPNSAQNTTNPQDDLIDGVHYSHFLDMAFIKGEFMPYPENAHPAGPSTHGYIPDYNNYGQSTNGQGVIFNENTRSEIPVLGPKGPIWLPSAHAHQQIAAPAELVFTEHEHTNARSTVDFDIGVATGLESAPSGELASPSYPDVRAFPEPLLMGSQFDFNFGFNFPLETNSEAAVHLPDIFPELDVSSAAGAQGAEYEANSNGAGGDGYVGQDGGRSDHSDDKENDGVELLSGAVFPDHLESTLPLEASRARNIDASNGTNTSASTGTNTSAFKETQQASGNVHLEKDTVVAENNDHKLDTAPEAPAKTGISNPSEASNLGTSKQKHLSKRDAPTAEAVSTTQKNADTLNISKDREAPRKKVRISKDQAIEGKNSGILTCDICLASSVRHSVYTFNRRADLNFNIRVVHEKTTQLTCPHADCVGKTFSKLSSLKRHKHKFGH